MSVSANRINSQDDRSHIPPLKLDLWNNEKIAITLDINIDF